MLLTKERALELLDSELHWKFGKTVDDVEVTNVRGYWQDKNFCDASTCTSPLHGYMGCREPVRHTYYFVEHGIREHGRFVSPYRIWHMLKA